MNSRRKLLVLDINGLLLDTYYQGETRPDRLHDAKVNRFYVYKRTFCDEFIQFCLENFIVGVWSSAREHNVHSLVDFMFKGAKESLAFIWHQQHCTDTGFRHPDNKHKPVFLKKMSRLWENSEPDLPWAKGDYGPSNTLLIDDSPYKAIGNPRYTAIFPKTFRATDPEDNYLAYELLPYLDCLLKARDVQKYIQRNPVGEASISASDPQWSQILRSGLSNDEEELPIPAHLMGIRVPVRMDPILPPRERITQREILPADGAMVLSHMSPETQTWIAAHEDRRWRRLDRATQPGWAYNGVAYHPQGFARGYLESGAGPSWPPRQSPNDTSNDLIRKHAMLSGRSNDFGDISRGDWRSTDVHSNSLHDDRTGSVRYDNKASGWSEGPENFSRGESWDYHPGGASYQGEGKRKRRLDSSRDPKVGHMDESRVIRPRGRSREADFEEPYTVQRRASPRHDQRREERQFRSKPREGGDLSRHSDKELPHERDLSEDSGRISQKHDRSNDGSQTRSRRKGGRKI